MKIFSLLYIFLLLLHSCSGFVTNKYIPINIKNRKYSNIKKYNVISKSLKMLQNDNQKPLFNIPISYDKKNGLLFYDVNITPEIWAIILVYFAQGLFGICRLALSFYYKDILHLTPVNLTIISTISAIPWIIKPLYGFISDTFPLFGYKRKSYLLLSGLLSSISWGFLAFLTTFISNGNIIGNAAFYSISLVTLSSLGLAFSDVLVDAIVVSKSRDQNTAGTLQSLCWTSSSIGGIISAYFSGYLLQNYGSTFVFSLTAIIPFMISATAGLIKENKIDLVKNLPINNNIEAFSTQVKHIWGTLSQKSILYPFIFLIIWNASPSAGPALFYFEANQLGFQPEFFGQLGLVSSLSSLIGIFLYNQKLKSVPLRTIFKWTCIASSILGMSPLILTTHLNTYFGLPDKLFAIIDDVTLSILGQITFMPILVLAASICPVGVEAMLFATIMSAYNLSGNFGRLFGGLFTQVLGITSTDFTNLNWLIILTNIFSLVPLLFLHFIPDTKNDKKI